MSAWRSWRSLSLPSSGWKMFREWNGVVFVVVRKKLCHLARAAKLFGIKPKASH